MGYQSPPIKDLPHQPSDIKPDEITEIEQAPPEVPVLKIDHADLTHEEKNLPPSLLSTDEELKEKLKTKVEKDEKRIYPELDQAAEELIMSEARSTNHIDIKKAMALTGYPRTRVKTLIKHLVNTKRLIPMSRFTHRIYRPNI